MSTDVLSKLQAARLRVVGEQRALAEQIALRTDPRPTQEERTTLERMDADIVDFKAQIDAWLERAERDKENDTIAEIRAAVVPQAVQRQQDASDASFVRFIRGEIPGNAEGGRAWDIDLAPAAKLRNAVRLGFDAAQARALSVVTAAAGGTLVPTTFVNQLYDYLEVYSGARRMGATILTTASGEPMILPKVATGGTAALVGEGSALAGSDPTFGRVQLGTWKYAQIVQLSSEIIRDAGVDVEGWLAGDFGRALGRVTNTAYTTGSGSNQPTGYHTVAGTAVTGANGGTGIPSFDNLLDCVYAINSEYRMQNPVWTMRDATAGNVRKIKDTTNQYLWQPSTQLGQPDRLLNFPVVENSAMPAMGTGIRSITFGAMGPAFVIRDVGAIRIDRSVDRYFDTDQVAWRAILSTDSNVRDLTAYTSFRGGTA